MNKLRKIVRAIKPLVPNFIWRIGKKYNEQRQLEKWRKNGCPSPPPHIVKQKTIEEYARQSNYIQLVETGTFRGDMIDAQKSNFENIISIELDAELFKQAKKRFKKDKHISITHGDSGTVLPEVMKNISVPTVFWLDGHYSGGVTAKGETECPIYKEIDAILSDKQQEHILLIDDARCFIGENDYPTIDQLTKYIHNKNDKYEVEVKSDIIRYVIPT